eukprot:351515-Chlamydomonas_euryale.AAC.1
MGGSCMGGKPVAVWGVVVGSRSGVCVARQEQGLFWTVGDRAALAIPVLKCARTAGAWTKCTWTLGAWTCIFARVCSLPFWHAASLHLTVLLSGAQDEKYTPLGLAAVKLERPLTNSGGGGGSGSGHTASRSHSPTLQPPPQQQSLEVQRGVSPRGYGTPDLQYHMVAAPPPAPPRPFQSGAAGQVLSMLDSNGRQVLVMLQPADPYQQFHPVEPYQQPAMLLPQQQQQAQQQWAAFSMGPPLQPPPQQQQWSVWPLQQSAMQQQHRQQWAAVPLASQQQQRQQQQQQHWPPVSMAPPMPPQQQHMLAPQQGCWDDRQACVSLQPHGTEYTAPQGVTYVLLPPGGYAMDARLGAQGGSGGGVGNRRTDA